MRWRLGHGCNTAARAPIVVVLQALAVPSVACKHANRLFAAAWARLASGRSLTALAIPSIARSVAPCGWPYWLASTTSHETPHCARHRPAFHLVHQLGARLVAKSHARPPPFAVLLQALQLGTLLCSLPPCQRSGCA